MGQAVLVLNQGRAASMRPPRSATGEANFSLGGVIDPAPPKVSILDS